MNRQLPTPVCLDKPCFVIHYVGTQNGGDHELIMRGTPTKITRWTVEYKITRVTGTGSGTDWTERFPFLVGTTMTAARSELILF